MFRANRCWLLSLLGLALFLGMFSEHAEAQTTVQVGGFNVQYWDPADGAAYIGGNSIPAGDMSAYSPQAIAAMNRAFLYWSDVLNLAPADANSPVIRMVNETATPTVNAFARPRVTNSRHNVIDRLLGMTPARDMGIDGANVYFQGVQTFGTGEITQFSNDPFSMEMIAIHELGHLLGIATYSHQPFLNQVGIAPGGQLVFFGANAQNVYGGFGIPLAGDQGHTAIPYENITRGLVLGNDFRNIPHASPAELAILADLGFNVVLSDNFGRAYYQNSAIVTDANSYSPGNRFGIGLYLLADSLRITQNGNLTANGELGTGVRMVGGMDNTMIVGAGSTVSANGLNGIGILASGGAGHDIAVRGTVQATNTNGIGILLDFGNPFLFTTITSASYQQALVDSLDISGTVTGGSGNAIVVANTAALNELNIMQGATINGNIINNGILNPGLNLNRPVMSFGRLADMNGQATNTPDNAFNFTYGGNIGGTTTFDANFFGGITNLNGTVAFNDVDVMNGSTLSGTGNLTTASVDIMSGGTVAPNGVLNSTTINVMNGATLSGDGTVNTTTLNVAQLARLEGNGTINATNPTMMPGTIAPGNSIGTMNFGMSIIGTPSTVLEIEAQPSAAPVPGVDSDLINVTGNYTFNGGFLNVLGLPPGGAYTIGSAYTYLQTTGGVVVNAAPTVADDLTNFRAIPFFTAFNGGFVLASDVPLANVAQTYNQQNFGTYFDNVKLDTTNANAQILRNNFDLLPNAAAVRNAMNQVTGEIHGTMAISQIQNLSNLFSFISDQIHHTHRPGQPCLDELWYSGYANSGQGQNDGNATETDLSATGHMLGKSWCLGNDDVMGLFYNYEDSRVRSINIGSQVESQSHRLGFYMFHQGNVYHALFSGFAGWNSLDSTRMVNVNALAEFNQGNYSGWNSGLYLEQGLTYGVEVFEVQPYIGLQLLTYQSDEFMETGGPVTALNVNDIHINSFRTVLGGRMNLLSTPTGMRLGMDAAWVHETADDAGHYQAGLISTPGAGFNAKGVDLGNDWVNIGPTLSVGVGPFNVFLDYQASIGEQGANHSGRGGAELIW